MPIANGLRSKVTGSLMFTLRKKIWFQHWKYNARQLYIANEAFDPWSICTFSGIWEHFEKTLLIFISLPKKIHP